MEDTAFIPETMTAMNALKLMRRQRLHMLVVVDEFGGDVGVVTLEDILETLVGEIYDEDDDEEVVEDMLEIKENDDGSYDIEGGADLEGVCAVLGLDLKEEQAEFATIAGYLCAQAARSRRRGRWCSSPKARTATRRRGCASRCSTPTSGGSSSCARRT